MKKHSKRKLLLVKYYKDKDYDFVENPWSTKKAAKALKMKEDEVYESLSNLAEYMRNNIHIHYKDGSIRIGAN